MLLRYAALYGRLPQTEEEWEAYREWKKTQLLVPECKMQKVEGSPECCDTCTGHEGCTKGKAP